MTDIVDLMEKLSEDWDIPTLTCNNAKCQAMLLATETVAAAIGLVALESSNNKLRIQALQLKSMIGGNYVRDEFDLLSIKSAYDLLIESLKLEASKQNVQINKSN